MAADIDLDGILASYRATVAATEHGGGVEDFAALAAWLPALCEDVARLRGRVAMLRTLVREVLDAEPTELLFHRPSRVSRELCAFCRAPTDSGVDDGSPHEPDCWIVRADATLAATEGATDASGSVRH